MLSGKRSADLLSYLNRVGKHSTKPHKTGDNAHLATQDFDIDYSNESIVARVKRKKEIDAERIILLAELEKIMPEIHSLKLQLAETLPFEKYVKLKKRKQALGIAHQQIQIKINKLRQEAKILNLNDFGIGYNAIFLSVARQILPHYIFAKIHNMVADILNTNKKE